MYADPPDDGNDGEGEELVATFGMLRSDLVDMLAAISISSSGLEKLIKTNRNLTAKDIELLAAAIENYSSLTGVFSLGGEITDREIEACVRKIYVRMDLISQMQEVKNALHKSIMEDQNLTLPQKKKELCLEEPDPYISSVFGNEYV